MADYAQILNRAGSQLVQTPFVYDNDVAQWMAKVQNYVYTGTLWVPRKGDANSGFVAGPAAHDAPAAGNPVQVGGVYRVANPALADGDAGSMRLNARGEAIVELSGSILVEQKTQADATYTAEVASLNITAAATVASNVTVTLNGVATTVAVLATDTAIQVADKIRATVFTGWATGGTVGTTTVTFTATSPGNKTDAVYSPGTTGATGTMTTTTQGTNLAITFTLNILAVEIYHEEATWQTFTVNGLALKIPAGGYRTPVGGTPATTVAIPAGISCIVGRLV